jgi:chaperone modulatory protein CbpM
VKAQASDWQWLDARDAVAADELCRACRITPEELDEIVGYGVLVPLPVGDRRVFAADWLVPLRTATRMRRDFDLDLFAVGLILDYLRRIEQLEREVGSLRAHLPSHEAQPREGPGTWHEAHSRDTHETPGARR